MPSKDNVSWMSPIVRYLKEGRLPTDKMEARKLRIRASHFQLLDGILYKMGFSRPHLRCLSPEEANYVIREVHEGICGNHSGARALAHKLTRAGYYWPSLLHDAAQYVKTCDKCQRFANIPRAPPEEITPMTSPWPFSQWGLDIMGPFPVGTKQAKFLVVAIDYFTKWVEAEPLATITEKNVKNFVWKGVICRFGIPRVLVSDNGKQFDNGPFRDLCAQLNIKNHYSSPRHPQANGQVEVTNRTLLKQIKTRLEGAKGLWVEELPSILWAYRTTVRVPTGETPFKLTFGTEAVIPKGDLPPRRPSWKKASLIPGMLNTSKSTIPETPTRCKVQKGVIETDAPRRTVRHPRGAKSRRESSKQMPLGGQSDTHEVQSPEGSHRNRCPSEDSQTPTRCKVQKGVIETDAPRRTVRHPRGAKSRRESSKQMPLGGQLDTHVVHVMKEGRPEDALLPIFYS
uniref:Integrase catalytic domain-containing protein n=1 Tax=Fagus sylvatica TaxID=28930 RepID=A0A2N9F0N5_FAGSY